MSDLHFDSMLNFNVGFGTRLLTQPVISGVLQVDPNSSCQSRAISQSGAISQFDSVSCARANVSAGHSFEWPCPSSPTRHQIPLRVAHIGTTLVRGGIESWLRTMVKFSRRIQIDRCVVTNSNFVDLSMASELGVPIVVGQQKAVQQAARECDVLICWGPEELAYWLRDCPAKLCVMVAHSQHPITKRIIDFTIPVSDAVIAVSERVRQLVCSHPNTTVIPHGVDASALAPDRSRRELRASLGFAPSDFVLGFVGRFFPEKHPEVVIDTLSRLPDRFKGLMVGWGPLCAQLTDMASHLIPGRSVFRTAFQDVGNYYHTMDALCVPSREEGFGLVILEAMMSGVPVVTTDVGCVRDLITDGVSGMIVEHSAAAFAAAAHRMAADPQLRTEMILRGRQIADEKGHALTMVEKYESLIERLWHTKFGSLRS